MLFLFYLIIMHTTTLSDRCSLANQNRGRSRGSHFEWIIVSWGCIIVRWGWGGGGHSTGRLSKRFFLGFENMGDMGWAGNALFGPWGGVTWAQLRYAGDGDSQFAWGSHEKAEKCDRVWKRTFFGSFQRLGAVLITFLTLFKKWLPANWS